MSELGTDEITNSEDVIDSRDVIARITYLEGRTHCDNCDEPAHVDDNGAGQPITVHEFGSTVCADNPLGTASDDVDDVAELSDPLDEDEQQELVTLTALAEEASGTPDWRYGETLIRDSYFEDYARELAEDIGAVNHSANWPLSYIDWPAAADALKQDYFEVDFDGVTYWVRS